MLSGDSGILATRGQVPEWFWWATVLIAAALPATYLATAFAAPMRVLHVIAIICVVGFLVVQVAWIPVMDGLTLANGGTPWLQGINALPSTLAGVVFATRVVWVMPATQLVLVPIVQLAVSDTDTIDAVLDGCGAVIFCSILTGMALAIVESGDTLDSAAATARRLASERAVAHTRERELARINAIVHDDVMSVLLAASRVGATPAVQEQAQRAQSSIAHIIEVPDATSRNYEADELVAVLRSVSATAPLSVSFTESVTASGPVPGSAVAALTEATAEAVRNCCTHAGPEASITIAVAIDAEGARVSIHDDGVGFSPKDVDPRRLGIAVSITERMHTVPRGNAQVHSRPGDGTIVELAWSRP
ncbi:ATP-binding protein [Demequina flava]|uniref:ATP-binding protein n=1 Tax=Demequina flava TaxID=1095025 RepID=UPI001364B1A5|nr:ATP-binding protein [Demequina flava]